MIYRFGDHELDTGGFRLTAGGEEIAVEPQVFSLLQYLIENHDRVVSKDEIIEHVWDGRIVSDGTLNSRINSARRALGDDGKAQAVIKTFPRRGYRFVAEITDDIAPEAQAASQPLSLPDKPSIAVLPFDNLSGDREQEYFSDGITEDIIVALSRIRQFFVIARNTTFAYKGQAMDVQAVAAELGVRYVLEGSVRKAGDRLRISAQLIDGTTGNNIWADHFDRDLADIFQVQDEITGTVVGRIEPELGRAERERARQRPPDSLDAWGLYYRGMSNLFPYTTMKIDDAQNYFLQALELNASFARAYTGLALCHFLDYTFVHSQPHVDHQEEGLNAARRAVELDEDDAAARAVLGLLKNARGDTDAAIRDLERAIEINPSYANAHFWMARAMVSAGRAEDSLEYSEAAIRLSPNDPMIGPTMVRRSEAYFILEDYAKAEEWAEKSLTNLNTQFWGNALLVASRALKGDQPGAEKALEELLRRKPDFNIGMLKVLGFSDPAHAARYAEGLRRAGAPE